MNMYGQGNGQILAMDFDCYGTESHLSDCQKKTVVDPNVCKHTRDAAAKCQPAISKKL